MNNASFLDFFYCLLYFKAMDPAPCPIPTPPYVPCRGKHVHNDPKRKAIQLPG
jgi:hypothetical protein